MRLPRREEPRSPFSKLDMAVERPRLRYLGREDDLALGVKEGKHRLNVRLIPGVHEPRNDLDVLLRHRLLRKAGGFEGLAPVRVFVEVDDLAAAQLEVHTYRDA